MFILLLALLQLPTVLLSDPLYDKYPIFHFDLQDSKHRNHEYSVLSSANSNNQQLRRIPDSDHDYNENYEYSYFSPDAFTNKLSGSAKSCTNAIPVIFRSLCVHWNDQDGFQFSFTSSSAAKQHQSDNLLWYYGHNSHLFDAKRMANDLYSSLNNDYDLDSIDLVQSMLHNLVDNDAVYGGLFDTFHEYAKGRSTKKCGFFHQSVRMCVTFNPCQNRMSVKMALPSVRFLTSKEITTPANFDAMMDTKNMAESAGQYYFEEKVDNAMEDIDDYMDDYENYGEEEELYYEEGYEDEEHDHDDFEDYDAMDYYSDYDESVYGDYYNDIYLDDDFHQDYYDNQPHLQGMQEWFNSCILLLFVCVSAFHLTFFAKFLAFDI